MRPTVLSVFDEISPVDIPDEGPIMLNIYAFMLSSEAVNQ